jgi:ribonuclease HI
MTQVSIYVDGGSRGNPGQAAAAFVVVENGKVTRKKGFFLGTKTNNEAEYSSVIFALKWLTERKEVLDKVNIFLDSELVTKQLRGEYKMKSKNLMPLLKKARSLEKKISSKIIFRYVPREKNRLADHMVNKVLDEL